MIKSKTFKVAFTVMLLLSTFTAAQAIAEKPTITISKKGSVGDGKVYVTAIFQNEEDVGVYGTAIATAEGIVQTYTSTSQRIYFPPHEQITLTFTIGNILPSDYIYFSNLRYMTATNVILSEVELVEGGGEEEDDSIIDGGGQNDDIIIDGGGRGQREDANVSLPFDWTIVGVGIVAVVVVAAVVVVKRKKLTENDLRKLPSNEFQNWITQRLLSKASSMRDTRLGIDAYTAEGYPIQIKQLDNIGRNEIETFASIMGRIKAKNGIVVAFSFSDDVYRGIVRARVNYGIEIKKITVKELIERRKMKSL